MERRTLAPLAAAPLLPAGAEEVRSPRHVLPDRPSCGVAAGRGSCRAGRGAPDREPRHHPQAVRGSMPYGSFDTLSASTQSSELDSASSTIVSATGAYPCFFRAPGGHDASDLTRRLVADRRMTLVHWSVSSGDSGQPGRLTAGATSRIVADATRSPGLHPVVLMHDGKASAEPESAVSSYRGNTVAALPRIIRWYKARHYVFVDPAGRKF